MTMTGFSKETPQVEMAWSQPKMNFEMDFSEMWGRRETVNHVSVVLCIRVDLSPYSREGSCCF